MQISKEDLPLYIILVLLGSSGGTIGGNLVDNDEAIFEQKEMIQWQKINANELAIKDLEKQCP